MSFQYSKFCLFGLLPLLSFLLMLFQQGNLIVLGIGIYFSMLFLIILIYKRVNLATPVSLSVLPTILATYTAWLFLTLLWTGVASFSNMTLWILSTLPLSFFLSYFLLKRNRDGYILLISMILIISFFALWAAYQYWFLQAVPQASLENKNLLATLTGAVILLLSCYYLQARSLQKNLLSYFLLFLIFIAMICFATLYARLVSYILIILLFCCCILLRKQLSFSSLTPLLLVLISAYSLIIIPMKVNYFILPTQSLAPITQEINPTENPEIGTYQALKTEKEIATPLVIMPLYSSFQLRLILWKAAWQLILEQPYWGTGLGSFPYRYAAIAPANDETAGNYVHNDFLQIWLEAGLPALLLLLAIPCLAAYQVIQLLCRPIHKATRYEAVFLLAIVGLFYGNAVFSFDLYYPPSLILLGICLARLHYLYKKAIPIQGFSFSLHDWLRPRIISLVFILGLLVWLLYFASFIALFFIGQKANHDLQEEKLTPILNSAQWLQITNPSSEAGYSLAAKVYLAYSSDTSTLVGQRNFFYQLTLREIERAEKTNHWDPELPFIKARLIGANQDWLVDTNSADLIKQNIEAALKINPRFYNARTYYANYLLANKQIAAARTILLTGLQYRYNINASRSSITDLIAYYQACLNMFYGVKGDEKYAKESEALLISSMLMEKERALQTSN